MTLLCIGQTLLLAAIGARWAWRARQRAKAEHELYWRRLHGCYERSE
jgi:hypothetical protein